MPGTVGSMIDPGDRDGPRVMAPEVRLTSPVAAGPVLATGRVEAGSGVVRDSSGSRPAGV